MAVRAFFALDIEEVLRGRLSAVQGRVDCRDAKVNWVPPENLHVTMNFLGDVGDDVMGEVRRAATEAAAGIEPFGFHVRRVICVPPRGQLRMIWAEAADPTGRMEALHDDLAGRLAALGFKEEHRRFKGHITLARVRFARRAAGLRIRQAVEDLPGGDFPDQRAAELVGYGSRLTPDGPVYTRIFGAALGGQQGA
jgi:2'-5' RNA ligase